MSELPIGSGPDAEESFGAYATVSSMRVLSLTSAPRISSAVALIGCATPSGAVAFRPGRLRFQFGSEKKVPGRGRPSRPLRFEFVSWLYRLISQRFETEGETITQH